MAKNKEEAVELALEKFKEDNIKKEDLDIIENPKDSYVSPSTGNSQAQVNDKRIVNLSFMGVIALIAGLIITIYFWNFDTTVAVKPIEFMGETYGGGNVHNIGLLNERQNGIIIGGILLVIGIILIAFGSLRKKS